MPLINHAKKEINAKLIYFGPEAAGKATNLNYIYSKLKESSRGTFKTMDLQKDRMLFFDFLPSTQGSVNGYSIRFHVYTISGNVSRDSSWKMVLKGVDGVVFVADSRRECMAANAESLRLLDACLASHGKSVADVPCVFQYNKQDVPGALAAEQVGQGLNIGDLPLFPAVATKGEGVLETIFGVVKMVLKNIRATGIDVTEQPENLSQMPQEAPPSPVAAAESADREQALHAGTGEPSAERSAGTMTVAPAVEIVGGAEVVEDGTIRLPLAIRYGNQLKKVTLNISLTSAED